jgi:hypothetical protein
VKNEIQIRRNQTKKNQKLDKPQRVENLMMQTTIQRKRERLFVGCRYIKNLSYQNKNNPNE